MNHANPETIINIHKAALKEFTDKGFAKASLRNITNMAGVTTGAFYGYYASKEELFDKLAGEAAAKVRQIFEEPVAFEAGNSREQLLALFKESEIKRMTQLTRYSFDNQAAMKLLVCGSAGTKYENFFHELADVSAIHAMNMMDRIDYHPVSSEFIHIIISGMFKSYCELIEHDITRCNAGSAVAILSEFYIAGWTKIFDV